MAVSYRLNKRICKLFKAYYLQGKGSIISTTEQTKIYVIKDYLLCRLAIFAVLKFAFRFVFFWCIKKPERFTILFRVFAMMNIMSIDHPLKIPALFLGSPLNALVDYKIVEY